MSTAEADEKQPNDGKDLLFGERPPPYNPEVEFGPPLQSPIMQLHQFQPQQPWGPTPPAAAVQPTTVVIQQPYSASSMLDYVPLRGLPHHATYSHCANCRQGVTTKVVHRTSCKTHLWALCLFLFLCWPCICTPYCKKSCLVADHYCTRCGSFLGNSTQ